MKKEFVYIVWKELGETPLEALERLRKEKGIGMEIPMTYAGRLDPMAEGVLPILLGERCKEKEAFLGLNKVYEVEILFGIETDTGDRLGLIKRQEILEALSIEQLEGGLKTLKGKKEYEIPAYASVPIQGKPAFWWARENRLKEIDLPKKKMEVFEVEFVGEKSISGSELVKKQFEDIKKVQGDFRQDQILKDWHEKIQPDTSYWIVSARMHVSSGTYIRSLAQVLASKVSCPATVYRLVRTSVGEMNYV